MMFVEKHRTLVRNLIERTNSGKIRWEESTQEGVFQVSFPEYTLVIEIVETMNSGNDISIGVYNGVGSLVDSLTDTSISDGGGQWYSRMKDLYDTARRQALGADKALDEILKSLGADD